MNIIHKLLSAALALGAIGQYEDELFAFPRKGASPKPYQKPKSLPRWKVGETIIYAKNEKDAIKYAKKRGVWKEGMVATII